MQPKHRAEWRRKRARVSDPRAVGPCSGVGILPRHQLERVHVLLRELIEHAHASRCIQAHARVVIVDRLRRVRVQRALVDIGTIGQHGGKRRQPPPDESPHGGVIRQRGSLIWLRHQDVAVHVAAQFLLAAVEGEVPARAHRKPGRETVIVLARGQHIAHLKERARGEYAVQMRPRDVSVKPRLILRAHVHDGRRCVAELGAEVAALGPELGVNRRRCAQPDVQLLQRVVVDEIELDVLVAAAFARVGVGLPEQVQFDAAGRFRLGLGGLNGFGGLGRRLIGLCAEQCERRDQRLRRLQRNTKGSAGADSIYNWRVSASDQEHLRYLEIGHYVYAGISLLWCLIPGGMFFFGGLMLTSRVPGNNPGPPLWFSWLFASLALFMLTYGLGMAVVTFLAGRWIAQRRRRLFCTVVAGMNCLHPPFGVALGVFTILVLQTESVKQAFDAAPE